MKKKMLNVLILASGCLTLPVSAAPFDGAQPLICASTEILECIPGDGCSRVTAESIDAPQFIRIDFAANALSAERVGGGTKVSQIERSETVVETDVGSARVKSALADGKWKGTYAAQNKEEYWAEGVQSWFDTNRSNDHEHNDIDTRDELKPYDPGLAALLAEVFGDNERVGDVAVIGPLVFAAWAYHKIKSGRDKRPPRF